MIKYTFMILIFSFLETLHLIKFDLGHFILNTMYTRLGPKMPLNKMKKSAVNKCHSGKLINNDSDSRIMEIFFYGSNFLAVLTLAHYFHKLEINIKSFEKKCLIKVV